LLEFGSKLRVEAATAIREPMEQRKTDEEARTSLLAWREADLQEITVHSLNPQAVRRFGGLR
jgi:hypothetical protein